MIAIGAPVSQEMPWHLSGGSWPPPHCVLTQTLLETEYPVPLPLSIRRTGLKSQVHPWTSLSSAASRKALLPVTVGFRALTYDFGRGRGEDTLPFTTPASQGKQPLEKQTLPPPSLASALQSSGERTAAHHLPPVD